MANNFCVHWHPCEQWTLQRTTFSSPAPFRGMLCITVQLPSALLACFTVHAFHFHSLLPCIELLSRQHTWSQSQCHRRCPWNGWRHWQCEIAIRARRTHSIKCNCTAGYRRWVTISHVQCSGYGWRSPLSFIRSWQQKVIHIQRSYRFGEARIWDGRSLLTPRLLTQWTVDPMFVCLKTL